MRNTNFSDDHHLDDNRYAIEMLIEARMTDAEHYRNKQTPTHFLYIHIYCTLYKHAHSSNMYT